MARITFNCFNSITIINQDETNSCLGTAFDFSSFDYIDLSFYGGDTHVPVTSNEEIIAAFDALGIKVKINQCEIFILDSELETQDIPGIQNCIVTLEGDTPSILPCVGDEFDFANFNRIDLSNYGGSSVTFVYSNQDIIDALSAVLVSTSSQGVLVTIDECNIIIERSTSGICENIVADAAPVITVIGGCDYAITAAVDMSFYGGDAITVVSSDQDIINAFAALGISVTIDSCNITLTEFIGPTQDLPSCAYEYITFTDTNNTHCNSNTLDFSELDFVDLSGYGLGDDIAVANETELLALFTSLGITTEVVGCTLKVTNPLCTAYPPVPTRKLVDLALTDITVFNCQEAGTCWTFNFINAVTSDLEGQNVVITQIAGQDIVNGQTVTVEAGLTITLSNDTVLEICTDQNYSNTELAFTITMQNDDGATDTATVNMCWELVPVANPDLITIPCNGETCVNVVTNDLFAAGVVVTEINNVDVVAEDTVVIIPGQLSATLQADNRTVCVTALGDYQGNGMVQYEISNGVFSSQATIDYTIEECDPCEGVTIDITFNVTDETCNDINTADGQVQVIATGGTAPYLYNGNPFNLITGLSEGDVVNMTVTDANGCEGTNSVTVGDQEDCPGCEELNEEFAGSAGESQPITGPFFVLNSSVNWEFVTGNLADRLKIYQGGTTPAHIILDTGNLTSWDSANCFTFIDPTACQCADVFLGDFSIGDVIPLPVGVGEVALLTFSATGNSFLGLTGTLSLNGDIYYEVIGGSCGSSSSNWDGSITCI